jgi:hypothetical protein
MLYFYLLALLLAVLTLSCPPPFNDMRFTGNSTHTSAQLIEAALAEQGLGWTEAVAVQGSGVTPWPLDDGEKTTTITFCFWNEDSYLDLKDLVFGAMDVWMATIGEAGKENGHSVQFATIPTDDDDPQFCLKPDNTWNSKFPEDALVIELRCDLPIPARATMGWKPPHHGQTLNEIQINPDRIHDGQGWIAVYEIGEWRVLWAVKIAGTLTSARTLARP